MKIVLITLLLPLSAGYALADTTSSDKHPATMEQQASPSNPVKQDEERTEAHSQPEVPQAASSAAPAPVENASQGASAPTLPASREPAPASNRANSAYYYQSGEFNEIHPEEAYPNNLPRLSSNGDDSGLIAQVQRRLHAHGFDAGPVNGDFGSKTQAALAQFQLSQSLPVSGSLDSPTLNALGVVAGLAPSAASTDASDAVNPPSPRSP
jgi:Putative peptidoglycan binding domain